MTIQLSFETIGRKASGNKATFLIKEKNALDANNVDNMPRADERGREHLLI